jgi:hypothetical protein
MLRPALRRPTLVVAIMVVVLGLVAPLATRAAQPGAVAVGPTAAAAGGEEASGAGGTAGEHAETVRRAGLPAGARAIVRSAAEHLRSLLRPAAPAAVLVAAAFACLASMGRGAVPARCEGPRRRLPSPVRRRGPPALVVA